MPRKNLRIVLLCNRFLPNVGGIEQHVFSLAKELMKENYQVFVLTTNVVKGQRASLPSSESIEGVKVFRLKVSWWKGYLKQFYLCPSLILLLRKLRPDVVHVHSYWPYFLTNVGLLLSKVHHIPAIVTPHYHPKRSRKLSIYESLFGPLTLYFADFVIALTKSEATYYRHIGVKKVVVIPNGTYLPHVKESKLVKLFKKNHGLGNKFVLSVGRVEKRKGFEYLMYAVHLLAREFPSIQLAIVGGDTGYLKQLELLAQKLKIAKHFVYLKTLGNDDLSLAYESSYLVAIASSYEAFGITAVEAWAHKKPVIATRVGGLPSIVSPDTGMLIDYGDVKDLANAIKTLFLDKKLYERMGNRGFGIVKDWYTWTRIAKNVAKVYDSVKKK